MIILFLLNTLAFLHIAFLSVKPDSLQELVVTLALILLVNIVVLIWYLPKLFDRKVYDIITKSASLNVRHTIISEESFSVLKALIFEMQKENQSQGFKRLLDYTISLEKGRNERVTNVAKGIFKR